MKLPQHDDEDLWNLARGLAKLSAASFAENKLPGRWMVCRYRAEPEFDGDVIAYMLTPAHPDVDFDDPLVPLPGSTQWDEHVPLASVDLWQP
jgi:hypothetical protein